MRFQNNRVERVLSGQILILQQARSYGSEEAGAIIEGKYKNFVLAP